MNSAARLSVIRWLMRSSDSALASADTMLGHFDLKDMSSTKYVEIASEIAMARERIEAVGGLLSQHAEKLGEQEARLEDALSRAAGLTVKPLPENEPERSKEAVRRAQRIAEILKGAT